MPYRYGYGSYAADPIGNASKTFDFVTKALNYGGDRERAIQKENLQMDALKKQNEAASLRLQSEQEDLQLKRDLRVAEPFIAQYIEWENSGYQEDKAPQTPENISEVMQRLGAGKPLSAKEASEAKERALSAKQALAMLEVAKTKHIPQLQPGQSVQIQLPEMSDAISKIDPERVNRITESKVDGKKYAINGIGSWFVEKRADGKTYVMPGLVRLDLDDKGQPIPNSQKIVPATESGDDSPDARLSFRPLEDYEQKLKAASVWNGALSYAGLAAAGSKSAAKTQADKERERKWDALNSSPIMRGLEKDSSAFGVAARDILDIYKETGGAPEEAAKIVSTAITRRADREEKNIEDLSKATTTLQAYAGNKKYPRTAQIVSALRPALDDGSISGEAALKIITLSSADEDRERNEQSKITGRMQGAGRGVTSGLSVVPAKERAEIARIESERKAHDQTVKAAAAELSKYSYMPDSPEKKAAQERYNSAIQNRDAFMGRVYTSRKTEASAPASDNVTIQGLTGGGASNNYGYSSAGGVRQPQTTVTPPKGFKNTGRTSGGKPVYTDGKRYWTP